MRTEHNVRFALLFGSAARGTDTPTSDVDVLIDLRHSELERIVDLSATLTATVGRRVDLLRLDDAETDSSLLTTAVSDGRVLVDRDGLWPQLQQRAGHLRASAKTREASRLREALAGIDRVLGARA